MNLVSFQFFVFFACVFVLYYLFPVTKRWIVLLVASYVFYMANSVQLTLFLLSVIRIMLPKVLLPATTALGTMDPRGREKGLEAGANVVMPNLSPVENRKLYELYDNKICTGDEAAK